MWFSGKSVVVPHWYIAADHPLCAPLVDSPLQLTTSITTQHNSPI